MFDKITFLGTGAGRVVVGSQMCATGGFVISLDKHQIHIDPGPGALLRYKYCNLYANNTNILCVSHQHIDHVHDAPAIIDAITLGGIHRRGYLLTTTDVLDGNREEVAYIQPYLKKALSSACAMSAGDKRAIDGVTITATRAEHDANCIGFIIRTGKINVGYTSDTQYFEGLSKQYNDCQVLICNVLRPGAGNWKTHLSTSDVIKILKEIKPKLCIITGFGAKMLRANPLYEAREIKKQTGANVIAAKDGLVIKLCDLL